MNTPSLQKIIRNFIGVMLLVTASAYGHCASNVVPLPNVQGEIELRVAYVINPRLPQMNDGQLQILLDATRETARQHFGVNLRFMPVHKLSIEKVFANLHPRTRQFIADNTYDFKSGKGDLARLVKAYVEEVKNPRSGALADQLAYVRPFFQSESSAEALGAAAARYHLSQVDNWKSLKALDGKPVIDAQPYNEFLIWTGLGYNDFPFEFVLTNQLIVSAEYVAPALSAAVRGGHSNGATGFNRASRTGTFSVWSTFGFTADDEWFTQLRGGERYGAKEAAQLAGISATHEIGHQLFHVNHPFGNTACLMNPVPMFAYRKWAAALSPKDCPLGSSPMMTPGAYKFIDYSAPN